MEKKLGKIILVDNNEQMRTTIKNYLKEDEKLQVVAV